MDNSQVPPNESKDQPNLTKTSLDDFIEQTNREIRQDMERTYSPSVIERFYNPRNLGPITNADGYARITGPCGDTLEIWLNFESGLVSLAGFLTDGCCPSIACGSMATELAIGKRAEKILKISQKDILESLGGLPEESAHCALLASNTLRAAVKDYLKKTNNV